MYDNWLLPCFSSLLKKGEEEKENEVAKPVFSKIQSIFTTTLVILFSSFLKKREEEKKNELAKIIIKSHAFQPGQLRRFGGNTLCYFEITAFIKSSNT